MIHSPISAFTTAIPDTQNSVTFLFINPSLLGQVRFCFVSLWERVLVVALRACVSSILQHDWGHTLKDLTVNQPSKWSPDHFIQQNVCEMRCNHIQVSRSFGNGWSEENGGAGCLCYDHNRLQYGFAPPFSTGFPQKKTKKTQGTTGAGSPHLTSLKSNPQTKHRGWKQRNKDNDSCFGNHMLSKQPSIHVQHTGLAVVVGEQQYMPP